MSRLEQDLSCSICRGLLNDPVVLSCSHSFCEVCLQNWWDQSWEKTCPLCKRVCERRYTDSPLRSLALKNVVETFAEQRGQPECSFHCEKLRLFCVDDEELLCLICRDSRAHHGHRFSPIEEAAEDRREQLRSSLLPLQDKLKVLNERRVQLDSAAAHIESQAQQTKDQMRKQFEKMHNLVFMEEFFMKEALRIEKQQKIQMMEEKMDAVMRDIEAISQTISETEEQLRAADASLLLQYRTTVEKVQSCPLVEEPRIHPGALIDQAKYLDNLNFKVWMKIKSLVQFHPVVLDPNRAGSDLVLSEDLTSVTAGQTQKVPQNPERKLPKSVFGSETLTSGTHSWDVDVSGSKSWTVGVLGSVQRVEETKPGVWGLCLSDNKYSVTSTLGYCESLSVENLRRVRVKLDCDRKTVTFCDADTDSVLYRVLDIFTGGFTPALITDSSLKILPKEVAVHVASSGSKPEVFQGLRVVPYSRERSEAIDLRRAGSSVPRWVSESSRLVTALVSPTYYRLCIGQQTVESGH